MSAHTLPKENESLLNPLDGEGALAALGPLTTPRRAGAYQRVLVVNSLTACDCYTGVVLRTCIDTHLAGHAGNRIQIWEPKDADVWSRIHDLLSPLPERCELAEDQPYPARNREVIVPAIRIDEPETASLLGHAITRAHAELGLHVRSARAAMEALVAFVDNARTHATESSIGVLVACAVLPQANELQLVALDLDATLAGDPDPEERLREAIATSRRNLGGFASLIMGAERRGLDATLRLATGAARARWRTEERLLYSTASTIPGFAADFTVRL